MKNEKHILIIILLLYGVSRVWLGQHALTNIHVFPDTGVYEDIANKPFLSSAFLAGGRPFFVPLIHKLASSNHKAIILIQTALATFGWSFLAFQAKKSIKHSLLGISCFVFILLFSLSFNITGWDSTLLSESVSLSFLAMLVGSWLWMERTNWTWASTLFFLAIAFSWGFTRETNMWFLFSLSLPLLVLSFRPANRKYASLALLFLILFAFNQITSDKGQRWVFPFQNVLAQRVLVNSDATLFFAACGMPVSPQLLNLTGGWASSNDWAFYNDPDLDEYRDWLHSSGKSCYIKWLLSNPTPPVRNTLALMDQIVTTGSSYFPGYLPILPEMAESILFPSYIPFLLLLSLAILALGYIVISAGHANYKEASILFAMVVLALPNAVLIWIGDAMEIQRHFLQVCIQFYLGFWLICFFALDKAVMRLERTNSR